MRKKRERKIRIETKPIGVRLDEAARRMLDAKAHARGVCPTALARYLITTGLDGVDAILPTRRRASTVKDGQTIREALAVMGKICGNLQRLYTALAAQGSPDAELPAIKGDLREIADRMRSALTTEANA